MKVVKNCCKMTQNEKDLLLKDLCARLPYGVKLHCSSTVMICIGPYTLNTIVLDRIFNDNTKYVPFDEFKPYLFPMSSMTWEQECQYREVIASSLNHYEVYDWLNKNHFDYRGLIPMGLAIDATSKNIY